MKAIMTSPHSTMFKMAAMAVLLLSLASEGLCDGSKDINETCSRHSHIINYIRTSDSPNGCMADKGLICSMSQKCICVNPAAIYEIPVSSSSSSSSSDLPSASSIGNSAKNFFKKLMRGETTTTTTTSTTPAPSTSPGITGGRCAGRAGSPCVNKDSVCVQNAACLGTPVSICRCQGIYSSNTQGMCSKSATVATQGFKAITSLISGK